MKLSIGAGERRLPGWIHLDIDPATRPDILADISRPLPFPDRSIECILCEEVITQIPLDAGQRFLQECRRILQADGVVRISTPDLARLTRAYLERPQWLLEIWEEQVGLPLQTGTAAEVLNTGLRAVGPFVYDEATLRLIAERAGFRMQRREVNESSHAQLRDIDLRSPQRTVSMYLDLIPASAD